MEESVLANFLPSEAPGVEQHCGLLHTYSQAIMKNGFSMSYILSGPELIRPLFASGQPQHGHAIPLNTKGSGSQYRKRCSEGVRDVEAAEAVREKYAGEDGNQKVLRIE